ncbi:MAG: ligase-associated DNA damage response exonuclease [Acidobacteriota bacterium]
MSVGDDLLRVDDRGLACGAGAFHIDPWEPVEHAIVTHAHADHARPGSARYLAAEPSVPLLRRRLGEDIDIEGVPFGVRRRIGDVDVSFHPAGHVRGSAQVRVDDGQAVWVASGDYKRGPAEDDPTCRPFEIVPCDVFITEATFALPIYRWPSPQRVAAEVLDWWDANRADGVASVLLSYALGKAQRLLALLAARRAARGEPIDDPARPVYLHGAAVDLTDLYRDAGVVMPAATPVRDLPHGTDFSGALIVAPPSVRGGTWLRRFGARRLAFASGWMRIRGNRRRRAVDRGFVLSDHADWPDLLDTIDATGAHRVLATHGYADVLARHLRDRGLDAAPLETGYGAGNLDDAEMSAATDEASDAAAEEA